MLAAKFRIALARKGGVKNRYSQFSAIRKVRRKIGRRKIQFARFAFIYKSTVLRRPKSISFRRSVSLLLWNRKRCAPVAKQWKSIASWARSGLCVCVCAHARRTKTAWITFDFSHFPVSLLSPQRSLMRGDFVSIIFYFCSLTKCLVCARSHHSLTPKCNAERVNNVRRRRLNVVRSVRASSRRSCMAVCVRNGTSECKVNAIRFKRINCRGLIFCHWQWIELFLNK